MKALNTVLLLLAFNISADAQGNLSTKEPPSPPVKKPAKAPTDSLKQVKKDTLQKNSDINKQKIRPY